MLYLYLVAGIALIVSLISSREKTKQSLIKAVKMFTNILPQFIFVLIAASLSLYFLPGKTLAEFISGKNIYISILIAALLGSIAFMPGFIVYPLSGILLSKGVPYAVLSAFTVALMNVGVLTLPIEKKYFGFKLSVIRNTYFFFVSIIIALTTGLFYGEL